MKNFLICAISTLLSIYNHLEASQAEVKSNSAAITACMTEHQKKFLLQSIPLPKPVQEIIFNFLPVLATDFLLVVTTPWKIDLWQSKICAAEFTRNQTTGCYELCLETLFLNNYKTDRKCDLETRRIRKEPPLELISTEAATRLKNQEAPPTLLQLPDGNLLELSDGKLAIVSTQNKNDRAVPVNIPDKIQLPAHQSIAAILSPDQRHLVIIQQDRCKILSIDEQAIAALAELSNIQQYELQSLLAHIGNQLADKKVGEQLVLNRAHREILRKLPSALQYNLVSHYPALKKLPPENPPRAPQGPWFSSSLLYFFSL